MVRFAVIGCGRISQVHLKALSEAKNAQLCAVCDIIEEKAKKRALEYNVPYYLDIETMLKEQKPDAALIGTPSGMHGEHAEICAVNGVNVLCEKPLEITTEKIDRMIRVCEENHVKLGGIFQRRTYTAAVASKNAINSGNIGTPVFCSGTFNYSRTQEYYDSDAWRGTWALDGGGALMNQAVHGIDMLIMLGGDVKSVFAKCETKARNIEVEDTAAAIIKYKNGALGVMEAATSLKDGQETVLSVSGTEGMISFGDSEILTWNTKDGSAAPSVTDSMGGKNCAWTGVFEGHRLLVENMADAIENGTPLLIPACDARKAVDVILAIYRSSQTGKEVFLDR